MLYSKLTDREIDTFTSYVNTYGASYDYSPMNKMGDPRHILRLWNTEKETLFHAFNDQLILEKPVEYNMTAGELSNLFYGDFYEQSYEPFVKAYHEALDKEKEPYSEDWYALRHLLGVDDMIANKVSSSRCRRELIFKNGNKVIIEPGAKVMRLLGKVSKNLGVDEEFEKFRLKHSLLLNQKSISGQLCLSIHPMDYITMSDNDLGWSSCMSWMEDGDYRRGTVEMLNSKYVIVAYLKTTDADKDLRWGNYSWNSKKWRTLIIAHPTMITSIKDYPFHNDELLNLAVEWVRELMNKAGYGEFEMPVTPYRYNTRIEYEGDTFTYNCDCNAMYNDFGCCEAHHLTVSKHGFDLGSVYINYSGSAICMNCGNIEPYYDDHNNVFGDCCCGYEEKCYCVHCGDRIYSDDTCWADDECYCTSCFDYLFQEDEIDGEVVQRDDKVYIYLSRKPDEVSAWDASVVTHRHNTRESLYKVSVYNEHPYYEEYARCAPHYSSAMDRYYWNPTDLTDKGLRDWFHIIDLAEYINS